MANVYSTRFLSISLEDGDVSYIVPDGKVAVVKSIQMFYFGGPTAAVAFVRASGNEITIARLFNTSGNDYLNLLLGAVVMAGEPIDLDTSSGNACEAYVSGYLLDLP